MKGHTEIRSCLEHGSTDYYCVYTCGRWFRWCRTCRREAERLKPGRVWAVREARRRATAC